MRRALLGFSDKPERLALLYVWSGVSGALVHRDLRENAARREARFLATASSKLRAVALSILRRFTIFPGHISQDMRTRKLMFETNDYGAILRSDDELSLPIAVDTRLSWHLLTRGDIYIVVHDECDEGPVGEIDARQLPVAIPWIDSVATLLCNEPRAFAWDDEKNCPARLSEWRYEIDVEIEFPAASRGDGEKCVKAPRELRAMCDELFVFS